MRAATCFRFRGEDCGEVYIASTIFVGFVSRCRLPNTGPCGLFRQVDSLRTPAIA
jgi:hypothetical protein